MSLKMNIETAIQIDALQLKELNKIGWMQYKISLYYSPKQAKQNIYFMASHIDSALNRKYRLQANQPRIDSYCTYSHKFQVKYLNDPIQDSTTYYFKVYLDLNLLEKVDFYVSVQLLFGQNFKSKFVKIHTFEGLIRKKTNLFTYLPICFDHYGSLSIQASYHSVVMEYRFQNIQDESSLIQKQFETFREYIANATKKYRKGQIMVFYNYYRTFLQNQLNSLQQRFNQYSKLTLRHNKKTAYTKLNNNKKIINIIQQFNSIPSNQVGIQLQNRLADLILEDVFNIKALIYNSWNQFNQLVKANSQQIIKFLKHRYDKYLRERLTANIISQRIKNHDWTFNKYGKDLQRHFQKVQLIKKTSKSAQNQWAKLFPIQSINFFQNSRQSIKIFQQIYQTSNLFQAQPIQQKIQHIVVLVHGFQAHRNDLIQLKLSLQARHRVRAFISCANIGKTNDSIQIMGNRLALQVKYCLQILKKPYKLSFIGHSMGGIIIRSALQHLQQFKDKFHAYISICTPHLGYLYASSKLVKAGLWLLNTFQKCDSMLELTMRDNQNLRETYLYKLAGKHQLNHFKKLAFIASSQDEYVQYQSARVEKNVSALTEQVKDSLEKEIICDMVDNILCQIQADQISRIDVIFNIQKKNFDSFIGRTGHVKFLCDPHFLKHFSICLDHLFI